MDDRMADGRNDLLGDYETLYKVMTRRLSARRLKPDPIPDDYIDKILEAGRWAMQEAVAIRERWRARGWRAPRIAVNVSPIQLRQAGFVDQVREILAGQPRERQVLDIEITESLLLSVAGAAAGLALAPGGLRLLLAINPDSLPALAPALTGAIFALTGKRVRSLPIDPDMLKKV